MKPYPSYKESGVEWIGEIPKGWELLKTKYFTQSRKEKSVDGSEELLSVSEQKGVIPRRSIREDEEHLTRSESLEGYLIVYNGDLVSNIMLMWKRGLGVSEHFGIVSPAYSVFSFTYGVPRFFHYLFRTDLYVSEFKRNSTGVIDSRLRLYDDVFGGIYTHFPPLSEQHQIVSFLDKRTSQIDELIEKKRKKIELLKEYRTSLINHTVTKGLNPNVEMKDSGVEWIGEIPKGWMISKPKYTSLTPVKYGMNISGDKYKDEGIRFIRITDITEEGELLEENGKYLSPDLVSTEFILSKYDVLFCRSGHTVGKSYLHLKDEPHTSGGYLVRFNFGGLTQSKFLSYITKTNFYWDWIKLNTIVSTIENVNGEKYSNMEFPLPPLSEQHQIVQYLDEQTSKIDEELRLEERKIELLKEYRTSLISDVVTGKICVLEEV